MRTNPERSGFSGFFQGPPNPIEGRRVWTKEIYFANTYDSERLALDDFNRISYPYRLDSRMHAILTIDEALVIATMQIWPNNE